MKRPAGLVLAAFVGVLVTSCGGDSQSLAFVGNDTCPTTLPGGAPAGSTAPAPYAPSPPGTNGDLVGQVIPEMPHSHVSPPLQVKYEHNPPTSGCHYSLAGASPAPAEHGVYTAPIAPEYWVHNLEHGYVVVVYNCPKGCDSDVKALLAWYKSLPPDPAGQSATCSPKLSFAKVVVVPFTAMAPKFAALAWDYYDPMGRLDVAEIQRFYDNHNGRSPEGICTG